MKRKMKALIAVLLSVLLFFTMTVTAFADEAGTSNPGGWTIEAMGGYVPLEVEKALKKASEGTVGTMLSPFAYMEKQIVNGVNYKVLCTSTPVVENPETKLVVAVVNVASVKIECASSTTM